MKNLLIDATRAEIEDPLILEGYDRLTNKWKNYRIKLVKSNTNQEIYYTFIDLRHPDIEPKGYTHISNLVNSVAPVESEKGYMVPDPRIAVWWQENIETLPVARVICICGNDLFRLNPESYGVNTICSRCGESTYYGD